MLCLSDDGDDNQQHSDNESEVHSLRNYASDDEEEEVNEVQNSGVDLVTNDNNTVDLQSEDDDQSVSRSGGDEQEQHHVGGEGEEEGDYSDPEEGIVGFAYRSSELYFFVCCSGY